MDAPVKPHSVFWSLSKVVFGLVISVSALVGLIGLLAGWKSSTPFSNSFFAAGSAIIVLGTLTILGTYRQRADFGVQFSQSTSQMNLPERTSLWVKDIKQGYNLLIICVVSGALLIGLAVLVDKLFGLPAL